MARGRFRNDRNVTQNRSDWFDSDLLLETPRFRVPNNARATRTILRQTGNQGLILAHVSR